MQNEKLTELGTKSALKVTKEKYKNSRMSEFLNSFDDAVLIKFTCEVLAKHCDGSSAYSVFDRK